MKRICSFVLITSIMMSLLLVSFGVTYEVGQTFEDDGFTFVVNQDYTLRVKHCRNIVAIIPESVNGMTVTEIDKFGCANFNLEKVTIPRTIKKIGESAFSYTKLTEIFLPNTIETIAKNALSNCFSLADIVIESGGDIHFDDWSVSYGADTLKDEKGNFYGDEKFFVYKNKLLSYRGFIRDKENPEYVEYVPGHKAKLRYYDEIIDIPGIIGGQKIDEIAKGAFSVVTMAKKITISNDIKIVNDCAFENCLSLTDIVLPMNIDYMGFALFFQCKLLKNVKLPENIKTIPRHTFSLCASLEHIDLPDGVTTIEQSAFEGCSSLASIELPDTVTRIEDTAFMSCSVLSDVVIPSNIEYLGDNVFVNCPKLTTVIDENGNVWGDSEFLVVKGKLISHLGENLDVIIPNEVNGVNVTEINTGAFAYKEINSIKIHSGVSNIGAGTFISNSKLKSVELPEGLLSISDGLFSLCKSLDNVIIPSSVTSIGKLSFAGCNNLKKITIPPSVNIISNDTFKSSPNVVIHTTKDSYADTFAVKNKIPVKYVN